VVFSHKLHGAAQSRRGRPCAGPALASEIIAAMTKTLECKGDRLSWVQLLIRVTKETLLAKAE
jgi:hypothetical protein